MVGVARRCRNGVKIGPLYAPDRAAAPVEQRHVHAGLAPERRRALRSARIAARQALAPAERSAATARIEANYASLQESAKRALLVRLLNDARPLRVLGVQWLAGLFYPKQLPFDRLAHTRAFYQQVLGVSLDSPAEFVLCWTADGEASGGTGQALRIAAIHGLASALVV